MQDHWSLTRRLTVDAGLRYDVEQLPSGFYQDTNNVSPRVGIAYHVLPTWILRAGYGIFFDRYVLANLNRAIQKDGVRAFEQISTSVGRASVLPSLYRADPRLATPYSQQASFAVEHTLARDLSASATYLLVRGVKLPRTRNINLLRFDPRFADIFRLEDSANSTYHGASLMINRTMSDELAFSGSYTLSKTFDDASDFDEQPSNPFNLAADRALSRQHQQHRLVFHALWELPIGDEEPEKPVQGDWLARVFGHIQMAPIFTLESGRPVNPLTGIDSKGSHALPLSARPPGLGRNPLKTPTLANVDFRVLKFFPLGKTARLDLVAEAFNLFNRTNVTQINPIFGVGSVAQFSLDLEF